SSSLKSTTAKVPASRAPTFTVNCNPVLFATCFLLIVILVLLPRLPHAPMRSAAPLMKSKMLKLWSESAHTTVQIDKSITLEKNAENLG
ncbi:hypothetical protein PO857_003091, partial [Pectobacterium carotovorum]|uniref:hypothetical protein n=2 Tax=Pectobacterium carotovorum TaxID=554 RepID=UPI00254FE1AE